MMISFEVVQDALDRANLTEKDLSTVAVTIGPGLSLCLHVGVRKSRRVSGTFNLPILRVHHMEACALVAKIRLLSALEKDDDLPLVGNKAPDFEAEDVFDQEFIKIKLSEYIGKKYVVLFLYPLDFTFVCPTEITA